MNNTNENEGRQCNLFSLSHNSEKTTKIMQKREKNHGRFLFTALKNLAEKLPNFFSMFFSSPFQQYTTFDVLYDTADMLHYDLLAHIEPGRETTFVNIIIGPLSCTNGFSCKSMALDGTSELVEFCTLFTLSSLFYITSDC